jgi:hypothetical protein
MKAFISFPSGAVRLLRLLALLAGCAGVPGPAGAYPPAPFHLVYGMLRDEYGTPLSVGAEIILETSAGTRVRTVSNAGIEADANFWLEVPMDAGLTATPYQPTALRPSVPFVLKVRIGGTTYLPIEMQGDLRQLGKPHQRTRLNLTLGEDSDKDGLPDAWERLINADIAQVRAGDDSDRDGLSNQQEYAAGTYAFDPENGFTLSIVGFQGDRPMLEFMAVTGRTYTVVGSSDLTQWQPLSFRLPTDAATASARDRFTTTEVQRMRIEVVVPSGGTLPNFFRLKVN